MLQNRPKTPKNAPKRPQVLPRKLKNSAAGPWERDRRTCFLVCRRQGVIPKAGGAAGDSAAGVLDPAAPPRGWAVSKLLWSIRSNAIDRNRFQNSLTSSLGSNSVADPCPQMVLGRHFSPPIFRSFFDSFRDRFLTDFGSFWGAILGSFSAF